MGLIARTKFEKKVICMPYDRLVKYLETAVGHKLNLPEGLDALSVCKLQMLITHIQSIDLICSKWGISDIDFIKQVFISRIRNKIAEKRAKEPDEYYPPAAKRPDILTDPLFVDDFTRAVMSLSKENMAHA